MFGQRARFQRVLALRCCESCETDSLKAIPYWNCISFWRFARARWYGYCQPPRLTRNLRA